MTHGDPLEGLFDTDGGETSELDYLTLGYDDLSNGHATDLLVHLPVDVVKVIHRYTFDGPTDVIGHISTLAGLIEGLDERDPSRSSEAAVELTREEIAGARSFFGAVIEHDKLPFIGRMHSPDDLSPDTVKIGWGVVDMTSEREDVMKYYATLAIMESFLADPATRPDYDAAMLAFMNDVIFRPGIVLQRG